MRYGGLHMSEITVTLPEDVLQRAQVLAEHSGKRVADLLAEAIELSFRPLGGASNGARPVTSWSDEEVLAGVHTDLPPRDDARLSELLDRQQAGTLTLADQSELTVVMERYQ